MRIQGTKKRGPHNFWTVKKSRKCGWVRWRATGVPGSSSLRASARTLTYSIWAPAQGEQQHTGKNWTVQHLKLGVSWPLFLWWSLHPEPTSNLCPALVIPWGPPSQQLVSRGFPSELCVLVHASDFPKITQTSSILCPVPLPKWPQARK